MREIKFRFWVESVLEEETGMYYPGFFQAGTDIHGKGWFDRLYTEKDGERYKFKDDTCKFTPLQYTGLKDKNGVEICEGDILHLRFAPKINLYHAVRWTPEKACFDLPHPLEKYEVVGNAYENPELLRAEA